MPRASVTRNPPHTDRASVFALTPREFEILGLHTAGHSCQAIAQRLGVQPRSVEKAIRAAQAKLRAREGAWVR